MKTAISVMKAGLVPISLIGLIPTASAASGFNNQEKSAKPNILVILVDDYGWMDCGFMGSKLYETPNIDRLAARGTIFTNGYAACQVSSPSRASIMTGLYTTRHGVTDWIGEKSGEAWRTMGRCNRLLPANYEWNLREEFITIAEALKNHGYATFMAGKWHIGETVTPEMQGFDVNKGGWSGGLRGGYFAPYDNPKLEDGPAGEVLPERLGRETATFIEDMSKKGEPFFAYLSFYAVHGPIQTSETLWRKYRDKIDSIGFNQDCGFEVDRTLPVRKHQDNPVYAGLIEMMDNGVGIVLDKLKELGLDDNTVIFFMGDNGGVVSGDNYSSNMAPLRGGKGRQWEGGIRVPFVVYTPKLGNGVVCHTPVSGIDVYPTAMSYAGVGRSKYKVDGVDISPLLEGKQIKERPLFWHYPHYGNQGGEPSSIIRKGDWKLIWYHEGGNYELYNLANDLGETTSVCAAYPKKFNELKRELQKWLSETNAVMPVQDSTYSTEKEKAYRTRTNAQITHKQENTRQKMMSKDWSPNATWWDSKTID